MKKTYQLYFEGVIEMEFDEKEEAENVYYQMRESVTTADISYCELRESNPNSVNYRTIIKQYS